MASLRILISLLWCGGVAVAGDETSDTPPVPEVTPSELVGAGPVMGAWFTCPEVLTARRRPEPNAPRRGRIEPFHAFEVFERVPSEHASCDGQWGRVGIEAWACLAGATVGGGPPLSLPSLLSFDPPRPDEMAGYRKDGTWPRTEDDTLELPFVYGKRLGSRWPGGVYSSIEAWLAGDPPTRRIKSGESVRFYMPVETERGTVLVQRGTEIAPLDEVYLYSATRFNGVDLQAVSPPEGTVVGWVVHSGGAEVRVDADRTADTVRTASHHEQLWLRPSESAKGWLEVVDPNDEQPSGWVRDDARVRWWHPAPLPSGVGAIPWIDVDLQQQILALYEDGEPRYLTLVSTGKRGHETPLGTYRIGDKVGTWDMTSRAGAAEPYHVEAVPWVMHFWPRYALHGAYWHDGFGGVRSHGCINLALLDAQWIFEHVQPALPPGWSLAWESPEAPGTTLRVRKGTRVGPVKHLAR
jgi:hypothetical protein